MKKNTKIHIPINWVTLKNICKRHVDFEMEEVDKKPRQFFLEFDEIPETGKKSKATFIQPGNGKPRYLGKVKCEFTKQKCWLFTKTDKKENNKLYLSAPVGESFKRVELPTPKILTKIKHKKKPVKK